MDANWIYFIQIGVGAVIGMAGQYIAIPLFLASFDKSSGPYFMIFWSDCLFNLIFWPASFFQYKLGKITPQMINYLKQKHWKFILIGIFGALYGMLGIFAAPLDRTPGSLQAILAQFIIPFTMFFSKIILKKVYTKGHYKGAAFALYGILISLIPTLSNFEIESFQWFWPLIFVISLIPAVLINIVEETIFLDMPTFDKNFMLGWSSLYQVLTILLLFWMDIIPGFGSNPGSLEGWSQNMRAGFKCFFFDSPEYDRCKYCFLCGFISVSFYCIGMYFSAAVMQHASANTNAIVCASSPVVVVYFWIIFSGLNKWAGGSDPTNLQIICYSFSLLPIVTGTFVFRKHEKEMEDQQSSQMRASLVDYKQDQEISISNHSMH